MSTTPIRLLLVDDHRIVCEGISSIMEDIEDIEDIRHEIQDSCVDIYNHALISWLHGNTEYVDDALQSGIYADFRGVSIINILQSGQYEHIAYIFGCLLRALEEELEHDEI